jgi:hypothetical protein
MYAAKKAIMLGDSIPDIAKFDNPDLELAYTMQNTSGSAIIDESINGRNGTITGASLVAGKASLGANALQYANPNNGSTVFTPTDFIEITPLDLTGDFTITQWVEIDAIHRMALCGRQAASASDILLFEEGADEVELFDTNVSHKITSVPLTQGSFIMMSWVRDGTNFRFYLGETQHGPTTISTNTVTLRFFGTYVPTSLQTSLNGVFKHQMLRVFSKAVSGSEFSDLNNGGDGR